MAKTKPPKRWDLARALPPGPARNLTIAAGVIALAALPVWLVYATLADQQKLKAAWTIAGPPCPPAPPPKVRVHWRGEHVFEYGGLRFSRLSGAVNCAAVPDGGFFETRTYRVCQFTAPGTVVVTLPRGMAMFEPGERRATVTVRHGAASCVLGGWFRG
ncbi:MAG: hypothetical protein JWQ29_1099 [Phenylobacterium sp.]|nr:hypothetical protein [Phenylobacterium sp.]